MNKSFEEALHDLINEYIDREGAVSIISALGLALMAMREEHAED